MIYERFVVDTSSPVSASQIKEALSCLYRWHLKYRRGIRAAEVSGPMQLGTMVHAGVEALFKGQLIAPAIQAKFEQEAQRLQELAELTLEDYTEQHQELMANAELSVELAHRAFGWFKSNGWEPVRFGVAKKPWVEERIEPTIDGVQMVMIPDFVLRDRDGRTIVWDLKARKSSSAFATQDTEDFDIQTILYQVGLLEMGVETHGTGILSVLARGEQPVKLNKNGMPSVSLSEQWCTGEAYRKVLRERGLLESDPHFEKILGALDARRWVDPVISHRSMHDFVNIWNEVVIKRLENLEGPYHRAFGTFECRRCWAREFCLAELRHEDVPQVIDIGVMAPEEESTDDGTTDASE